MSLASLSIRRPVLAGVLSFTIVLLGALSATRLGVREYPAVDPPVVTIITTYPGASAEVIESQITEPIEAAVNAVAGISNLTSISREGSSQVRVEFGIDINLEAAANDVRDQLGRASRNLPADANPPIVNKSDADSNPFFGVVVSSPSRSLLELSAYADNLRERLQTVPGVSNIDLVGEKRYAMRLWMDPSRLAAYGLTPLDVRSALQRENIELPSGRIEGANVELTVRTLSRLATPEEFGRVILKRDGDQIVRFSDIGYAELGPQNLRSILKVGSTPMIGVYVRPQPGANQLEISDQLRTRLAQIEKEKPADIDFAIGYDNTTYVRTAIHEVQETLLIAFGLVVLVIFIFLRDWRSTLIPMLAIPVSIVGTFLIMDLAGFSINVLTLLGLVLAIGLVVDDAIVVLENIYAKIEQGMEPFEAGIKGTQEIFVAVISTTIALAAVFMPVIFLGGLTGKLFREFGVVIAGAVIISAFVALTLTPMMSVRLLKPHGQQNWLYNRTEPFFAGLTRAYENSLASFLRFPWFAFVVLAGSIAIIVACNRALPRELTPLEDRGRIWVRTTAPEGASYDYTVNYLDDLTQIVREQLGDEYVVTMTQAPVGGPGGIGSANAGFVRVFLKDRGDRKFTQQELAAKLQAAVRPLTGARTSVSQEPSIGERRGAGLSAQLVIQAAELSDLEGALDKFLQEASKSPAFSFVDSDLKFNQPEVRISIDRDKAQSLGVSAADIASTLQAALSGQRFGYFIFNGKQYEVLGQLLREDRAKTSDLGAINVKAASGETIPLDNLITLTETSSAPQLYRYNRFVAATISGNLNNGYTLGQGNDALLAAAKATLDDRFTTEFTGASKDFIESSSSLGFVFALALILVYLVLAAQFESFRDPFTIMLTVPLALAGAFVTLWLFKETLNIFSQIGLIMLIGLVTKNGILLVEFATQRRHAGVDAKTAMTEAASSRFRPILMTSLCTILGVLPIALALGAGAESRVSMGLGVIGGLLVGTALTLYVIPAFYLLISGHEKTKAPAQASHNAPASPESHSVTLPATSAARSI
ncbi:acriflavin resistance protein [Nibricoccus aquaticus]|uniref:Acriflavin resistance protein n=1 Tax=Nibricoccus aquaticus TaxID=2576891 RepID=A0A290QLA4_9BACT|nr:efflux RND transporter permease subunit [Nibricoccus aquaticus]ATC64752.1 acriflavin resistance protein [Nibricoccus aquaticus]